MSLKKFFLLVLVIIFILGCLPVGAAEHLDFEKEQLLRQGLTELHISPQVQAQLIEKLQRGEMWDSMNPEKIALLPAAALCPTPDKPVRRIIFEDGSVLEYRMEFLNAPVSILRTPMPVYYYNVKVSATDGANGGGFFADYYIDGNGNDGITAVRDPYLNVLLGSYSNLQCQIVRGVENTRSKIPAEATLTAQITNPLGSSTFHIKMLVGNDKMLCGMLGKISANDLY